MWPQVAATISPQLAGISTRSQRRLPDPSESSEFCSTLKSFSLIKLESPLTVQRLIRSRTWGASHDQLEPLNRRRFKERSNESMIGFSKLFKRAVVSIREKIWNEWRRDEFGPESERKNWA